MKKMNRRKFLLASGVALVGAASVRCLGALSPLAVGRQRVYVGSNTKEGILAFEWDAAKGELTPAGLVADSKTGAENVDWIFYSKDRKTLFASAEVDAFEGKPGGGVLSYAVGPKGLERTSAQNAASVGTCHIAIDPTGRMLLAADYGGGSFAAYPVAEGKIGTMSYHEHFTEHGPNTDRQEAAHAHFASFSPDGRYAYINDLGGDQVHIYSYDAATAMLKSAGSYRSAPGDGPRTLHFHPNGRTGYVMNELTSSVEVVEYQPKDGSLKKIARIELLPADHGTGNTGCDTVISRDGHHVYFSNRGDDFLYHFHANPKSGMLSPVGRYKTGGKTPRNFVLSPDERFVLVACQNSGWISVFERDCKTGVLHGEAKTTPAGSPMCILF